MKYLLFFLSAFFLAANALVAQSSPKKLLAVYPLEFTKDVSELRHERAAVEKQLYRSFELLKKFQSFKVGARGQPEASSADVTIRAVLSEYRVEWDNFEQQWQGKLTVTLTITAKKSAALKLVVSATATSFDDEASCTENLMSEFLAQIAYTLNGIDLFISHPQLLTLSKSTAELLLPEDGEFFLGDEFELMQDGTFVTRLRLVSMSQEGDSRHGQAVASTEIAEVAALSSYTIRLRQQVGVSVEVGAGLDFGKQLNAPSALSGLAYQAAITMRLRLGWGDLQPIIATEFFFIPGNRLNKIDSVFPMVLDLGLGYNFHWQNFEFMPKILLAGDHVYRIEYVDAPDKEAPLGHLGFVAGLDTRLNIQNDQYLALALSYRDMFSLAPASYTNYDGWGIGLAIGWNF